MLSLPCVPSAILEFLLQRGGDRIVASRLLRSAESLSIQTDMQAAGPFPKPVVPDALNGTVPSRVRSPSPSCGLRSLKTASMSSDGCCVASPMAGKSVPRCTDGGRMTSIVDAFPLEALRPCRSFGQAAGPHGGGRGHLRPFRSRRLCRPRNGTPCCSPHNLRKRFAYERKSSGFRHRRATNPCKVLERNGWVKIAL